MKLSILVFAIFSTTSCLAHAQPPKAVAKKHVVTKAKSDGLTAQEREFLATAGNVDAQFGALPDAKVRVENTPANNYVGKGSSFVPDTNPGVEYLYNQRHPAVGCVVVAAPGAAVAACVSQ